MWIAPRTAALLVCITAFAGDFHLEVQTWPESPVVFVNFSAGTFREGADRRQFLTVKNRSAKATIALVFEQDLLTDSKKEIVTIERVSLLLRPGESRRLSISVGDMWNRMQAASTGKPVLSIVTVELPEGELWNAPIEGDRSPPTRQ